IVVLGGGGEEVAAGWTKGRSLPGQEAVDVGGREWTDGDLRRGQGRLQRPASPKCHTPSGYWGHDQATPPRQYLPPPSTAFLAARRPDPRDRPQGPGQRAGRAHSCAPAGPAEAGSHHPRRSTTRSPG